MTDQPTISINGVSYPILCGFCHAPIGERVKADADGSEFGCAACGNWADRDQVAAMVTQYAKDEGQLILNRKARDAASKSKIMTFRSQTEHDQTHRFIIKFEL